MKRIFNFSLLLFIGALMSVSCNKADRTLDTPPAAVSERGSIVVSISPDGTSTKAPSTSTDEFRLGSVQVFVFNATSGKCETDKYVINPSSSITLSTLVGEKKVWAVANSPRLYVASETALKESVSYLGDNSVNALVMVGVAGAASPGVLPHVAGTVAVSNYVPGDNTTMTPVTIPIYRLCARVSLKQVTVNFKGTRLEGSTFVIRDVYMKDVVNAVHIDGSPVDLLSSDFWTNRITDHEPNGGGIYVDAKGTSVSSLLCDKGLMLQASATDGSAPIQVNRNWYVYPNSCTENSVSSTWSPRHSRIVIHAQVTNSRLGIFDEDTYYAFSLPTANVPSESANVLLSNHTYDITNIAVSILGKPDDEDDTLSETGRADVTVSVQGWYEPYEITYAL